MTTILSSLNKALDTALAKDERVIILGEDILDPYGGAFKVTSGLSSTYPDRVLTTPVSEAGILGIATGMALRGYRPVVEIMFGDFVTLIADQVINHATKFRFMYNEQVSVPIVIRTPMGGRRGYGPTHSQTLEKYFLGTPGLKILAPNSFSDPGKLLLQAIFDENDPVLFVENKISYTQPLISEGDLADFHLIRKPSEPRRASPGTDDKSSAAIQLTLRDAPPPQVTIAVYGYMSELCRQAALRLAYEDEIFTEIVIFLQLLPVDITPMLESIQQSHRLLVVEEGTITSGWGAEVVASSKEFLGSSLKQAGRVACGNSPIPASSTLERELLPDIEDIILAVKKMV